jgi:hypothetical protein
MFSPGFGRDTDAFFRGMATGLRSPLRFSRHPVCSMERRPTETALHETDQEMTMKALFLALLAYAGYRLAAGIRRENTAEPLLLRDHSGQGGASARRIARARG